MNNQLELQKARRADQQDEMVRSTGGAKTDRIQLGLELLELARKPGANFSQSDIAYWCGCTESAVYLMEKSALRKLRDRLRFGQRRALFRELAAERRSAAG